jgi:hypothetical protein
MSTELQEGNRGDDEDEISDSPPGIRRHPVDQSHRPRGFVIHHEELPVAGFHFERCRKMKEPAQGEEHGQTGMNPCVPID